MELFDVIRANEEITTEDIQSLIRQQLGEIRADAERNVRLQICHLLLPDEPEGPWTKPSVALAPLVQTQVAAPPTFGEVASLYLRSRAGRFAATTLADATRVFDYLDQHLGRDTPLPCITKADLRTFRSELLSLSRNFRGRDGLSFQQRQTGNDDYKISTKTAAKYWSFVSRFFRWCAEEGYLDVNPAEGVRVEVARADASRSPAPFASNELAHFFSTPVYQGHQSVRRLSKGGTVKTQTAFFWFPLLALFTGARAGELTQLLTTDFDFESTPPVVHIREEDATGKRTKTLKTKAASRVVPLAPILLRLGLREFVQARLGRWGEERLLREIPLGSKGRASDGATKFYGRYLRKFGLYKPGRATHAFRHSAVAALRRSSVPEETIQALIGHKRQSVTSRYGGPYPIGPLYQAVCSISYDIDIEAVVASYPALSSGSSQNA